MNWRDLEVGAPALADLARRQFAEAGMAVVGTLRRDGSPRISCVYPCVLDEELYLGMMWRSRKAIDLLRDPRLVLHNAVSTNRGDETEVILRGKAIERGDDGLLRRYLAAVPEWGDRRFHLFVVDLESAAIIRYESGTQQVSVWPQGVEFTRPY
ncbi:MAG TPA: pyridoxamine 5'-phosphate oxidase family protein [Gaiellaceae bacterium]|nr:pyridoxamine 5'-phosphate oxidase family protein [Gaiellaceae bacterium]